MTPSPDTGNVLFTPEYSDLLLQRVQQIYKNDILHSFPQLKLQKLIDLLEHTEYLFELYLQFVSDPKTQNDALQSFIIGGFYIYLIMPQSIQFQSKNKSHTIYNEVRNLYESQLNMTNVLLMVKDEVEIILENSIQSNINKANARITRKRAYSVPSNTRGKVMIENVEIPLPNIRIDETHDVLSQNLNHLQLNDKPPSNENNDNNIPIYSDTEYQKVTQEVGMTTYPVTQNQMIDSTVHQTNNDSEHNVSFSRTNHDEDFDSEDSEDQKSPLWKAPNLEPNDQLKLATYMATSDVEDDSNEFEPILVPNYAPPPIPNDKLKDDFQFDSNTMPKKRNQSVSTFVQGVTYGNNENREDFSTSNDRSFQTTVGDRSLTHRKNSYHSVYMLDTDETTTNSNYYDESNGFIQSLDRLQKQSIITAPELFSLLSNQRDNDDLLLIDLRTDSRFQYSHALANNLVHIDPHLLWDPVTKSPIYEMEKVETILSLKDPHSANLFNSRDKFNYIVYYSDMKTFMKMKFDYHFTFFYLLITSKVRKLNCVPTTLLGGYEKWKKVITTYSKDYEIDVHNYLYRSKAATSTLPTVWQKKIPYIPPSSDRSWKPLEVPVRIRKRPPPPPPSLIPQSPEIVPKIPPRIRVEGSPMAREYPFMADEQLAKFPPRIQSASPSPSPSIDSTTQHDYSQQPRRISAPAIRKSERIPIVTARTNRQIAAIESHHPVIKKTYTIPTIERNPNIYVSLSITGLRNLGNTCYINSMIQCLFATKGFRDLFISSMYKKFLKANKTNIPQISNGFYLLFKKMYLNGGCSVVPISFLKICNILRPDLKIPDDQQDTTEFLMLILDKLHDELSNQDEVVNEYPKLMLYDEKQLNVEQHGYKKWFDKNVLGNGLSPIDDIFQGQIEHSLQCQRCGHSSYNYSTFYVLSLAIPKPTSSTFTKHKRVQLEDCLNMYTSDEVLSGENAWECPHCCKISKDYKDILERNKVTKQMIKDQNLSSTISSTSNSTSSSTFRKSGLFSFSRHHRHRNSSSTNLGDALKASQKVGRSLSPFRVLGSSSSSSSDETASRKKAEKENLKWQKLAEQEGIKEIKDEMKQWKTKKLITVKTLNFISLPKTLIIHLSRFYYDLTKKNDTIISYPLILEIPTKNGEKCKYRLYGLVNHTGNLISGHYTSLVNKEIHHSLSSDEQKWYYFDDEVVKEEKRHGDIKRGITKISSSDVYVLFYERME